MKVCVVAPEHPNSPNFGGIARYLRDYLPPLREKCRVMLISVEDGKALPGIRQHIVARGMMLSPLAPFFLSRKIEAKIKEFQPDVVEYSNWMGLACRDNGPWARVVRLSTPAKRGNLRPGLLPKLARLPHHHWEKKSVDNAHLLISNSLANYELCRELYGFAEVADIIPLGYSGPIQNISSQSRDIIYVGRFDSRKGVDILLKAWNMVICADEYDGGILHLVGGDTPGKGPSYLQDCLNSFDTPMDNLVVHGRLSNQQLSQLRNQCGIAVIPSRYESFGLVVLEAFAEGHAIVASRVGGLAEIIQHRENGLLFSPNDPEELASKLVLLLNNSQYRVDLAEAGQHTLSRKYSIAQMVDLSLQTFHKAIMLRDKMV